MALKIITLTRQILIYEISFNFFYLLVFIDYIFAFCKILSEKKFPIRIFSIFVHYVM